MKEQHYYYIKINIYKNDYDKSATLEQENTHTNIYEKEPT